MVQTPDGYLWFGTFNGLVRFDGVKFTVFDRSNTPELPSPGIVNLHLDRSGGLWVSTLLGMAYLKDGQWRVFLHDSGWAGTYARFFAESASGQLYVADWDGRIFKFRDGGFEELSPPPANPKLGFVLHVDADGNLWVVNPQFIGRLVEGKWQQMIAAADLLKQDPGGLSPWIIAGSSRDGGLWIATRQHLRKYRGGRLTLEARPPWPMEGFWSLQEDSEGNVWICSWKAGLYRFSPDGRWRFFSSASGLSYHATRFVFEDRERNWWIGTYGGGLDRFKRRYLNNWGLAQGLPERSIKSVTADRQGRIVMATFGQGVVRLEGKKINRLLRPGLIKDIGRFVQATLVDHAGRLWVGTLADGLFRMDNTARPAFFDDPHRVAVKQVIPPGPTRTEGSIYSLFEDSHGSVWAGTTGGGIEFHEDRSKKYGIEGAPSSSIRCFAEDSGSGTLWAGAIGLYRLEGGDSCLYPKPRSWTMWASLPC